MGKQISLANLDRRSFAESKTIGSLKSD